MPAKKKTETRVVAYKGFNSELACAPLGRVFAYKVGKTYTHSGAVVACASGFHACENPFTTWEFYPPTNGNRFGRVTLAGKILRESTKIVGASITIDAELALPAFIKAGVVWIQKRAKAKEGAHSATTGDWANSATTGEGAHSATTGEGANSATTGYRAHSATTGEGAHSATTGYRANSATTGYRAHSATTGEGANSATTGYRAHSATTGDWANSATTGDWANSATTGEGA
ncbi:MAG: DUF7666 domain-containing protein, partial [Shewanella sp.]